MILGHHVYMPLPLVGSDSVPESNLKIISPKVEWNLEQVGIVELIIFCRGSLKPKPSKICLHPSIRNLSIVF